MTAPPVHVSHAKHSYGSYDGLACMVSWRADNVNNVGAMLQPCGLALFTKLGHILPCMS